MRFQGTILRLAGLLAVSVAISACSSTHGDSVEPVISNKVQFDSKTYGVAASPRVTTSKHVKKGGGRMMVGKPYKVKGKWYYPTSDPNYKGVGMASWYGANFHGRLTANGEVYDQYALSAAHKTLPLPSYARVTNVENGSSVLVRINDRGPYHDNREIDLSNKAAEMLGFKGKGIAKVKVEYAGPAQMDGKDEKMLLASYVPPGGTPGDLNTTMPGTMVASNDSPVMKPVSNQLPGELRGNNADIRPVVVADNGAIPDSVSPTAIYGGTQSAYSSSQTLAAPPVMSALDGASGSAGDSYIPTDLAPKASIGNGKVYKAAAYQPSSSRMRPMGYAPEANGNNRVADAFAAVGQPIDGNSGGITNAKGETTVNLGSFASLKEAEKMESALSSFTIVKIAMLENGSYGVSVLVNEDRVGRVIDQAAKMGVSNPEIGGAF